MVRYRRDCVLRDSATVVPSSRIASGHQRWIYSIDVPPPLAPPSGGSYGAYRSAGSARQVVAMESHTSPTPLETAFAETYSQDDHGWEGEDPLLGCAGTASDLAEFAARAGGPPLHHVHGQASRPLPCELYSIESASCAYDPAMSDIYAPQCVGTGQPYDGLLLDPFLYQLQPVEETGRAGGAGQVATGQHHHVTPRQVGMPCLATSDAAGRSDLFDHAFASPVTAPCHDSRPRCYDHGCRGRVFSCNENYRRHVREQERVKVAHCKLCGLAFSRKSNRDKHTAKLRCGFLKSPPRHTSHARSPGTYPGSAWI
ncbi:hypothetical protein K431DRAFT_102423 [Polychaeton citri CBS 116435]|uniref:C2H2-type domain-containing protein n=1 Tax=Polychaeton citri CBS 116435 TaxID=1314669 RepID=A0A9P4Q570_9PEZI|nr:hypothetical protein K431DRAFT_102423 [Polychaeton citri CBS 116435]